jgi:protein-tyrosine phosphatase
MIDLHCHLLPGIDDGPTTLEESLELCRIAVADGITRAIVTPHIHPGRWENTRTSIEQACSSLQQALDKWDIPLQLGFAAEVRLTDSIPAQIARDEIPFYGEVDGYRVMLLEFPHGQVIPGSEKLAQWLLDQGIRPMIAHPERNRQIMKNVSQLQPFITLGCWLQVTAGSVVGHFGAKSQAIAHQLLENDTVMILASDGHNARARPPALSEAFACIAKMHGQDRAQRLMLDTPEKIVAGQFTGAFVINSN